MVLMFEMKLLRIDIIHILLHFDFNFNCLYRTWIKQRYVHWVEEYNWNCMTKRDSFEKEAFQVILLSSTIFNREIHLELKI